MLNNGQIKGISVIAVLPFLRSMTEAINKAISRSVTVSAGFPALNSGVAADPMPSLNCRNLNCDWSNRVFQGKIIHLSTRIFKDNSANDLYSSSSHTLLYAIG